MAMACSDQRPVCKYGASCLRKNPQHFKDFRHPASGDVGAIAAVLSPDKLKGKGKGSAKGSGKGYSAGNSAVPPPPADNAASPLPSPPAARAPQAEATGRKCKFGCGRAVAKDSRRSYNTCCRRCGVCQGSGEHDEHCSGGACSSDARSSAPSEAMALVAVDHALELRRRAKECETAGEITASESLLSDAAERLETARAQMPPTSKLALLLDRILAVSRGPGNDITPMNPLEDEVDAELDRLVAELDETVSAARQAGILATVPSAQKPDTSLAAVCTFGCGRVASRGFSTCCRACAKCRGGGSHDVNCTGPVATPSTALVPICTALATTSGSGSDGGARGEGGTEGTKGVSWGEAPAQAALRSLGLDDAWPTELTLREIRRRYMREALSCHPDKGSTAERDWRTVKFQEIADAYATLESAVAVLERIRSGEAGSTDSAGVASTDARARTTDCGTLALKDGMCALEPAPGVKEVWDNAPRTIDSKPDPSFTPVVVASSTSKGKTGAHQGCTCEVQ